MDNDNLLVQKAADLYRGLRFKMKYRGVPILSAGAGNDLARDLLESGQPFLFGRCGATEMRTAADYLAAADAARRNPHETPAACEARARYYEAKARELTTTERTP